MANKEVRAFGKDGTMTVNGKVVRAAKAKTSLSSNNITVYVTTLWQDGFVSCNCAGWVNRKNCKHCKESVACNYTDMTAIGKATSVVISQPVKVRNNDNEDNRMVEI